jgi:small-conductance mechanosensitive channel
MDTPAPYWTARRETFAMLLQMSSAVRLVEILVVFIVTAAVGFAVRFLALKALQRSRHHPDVLRLVDQSVRLPSILFCILFGLYVTLYIEGEHLPGRHTVVALTALHVFLIVSVTFAIARLVGSLVTAALRRRDLAISGTELSLTVIKVGIWLTGFLMMLNALGIAITPLLTALGIGGLAVSLALQDTLSNFFAGIYVLLDKPIGIGDTVKLESGHEGMVLAIGWRTTRLRNTSGEIIVVPNNKVVQSVLINTSSAVAMPRQASDNKIVTKL